MQRLSPSFYETANEIVIRGIDAVALESQCIGKPCEEPQLRTRLPVKSYKTSISVVFKASLLENFVRTTAAH